MLGFWNYTVWATYASLASGVLGIFFACSGHPLSAVFCLAVSGFCDAFDGRIARTRTTSTEQEKRFGIQLDSLCDLICFGVLPTTIGYAAGLQKWYFVPVFLLFILGALIRLAYFNVMAEEYMAHPGKKSTGYLGLAGHRDRADFAGGISAARRARCCRNRSLTSTARRCC